jgi:deoxyribonuclease V
VHLGWPRDATELEAIQETLAAAARLIPPWQPPIDRPPRYLGTFVASSISGADRCWVGACVLQGRRTVTSVVMSGAPAAPYRPGYLALREGPLLEAAVRHVAVPFDVLLVNATGRDHPRRAGLALHLGAVLDVPTVGVTDRPLVAEAEGAPEAERGSSAALLHDGEVVGALLRTRRHGRPVVVHPGWRMEVGTATALVLSSAGVGRTPEPIRRARQLARIARAHADERR